VGTSRALHRDAQCCIVSGKIFLDGTERRKCPMGYIGSLGQFCHKIGWAMSTKNTGGTLPGSHGHAWCSNGSGKILLGGKQRGKLPMGNRGTLKQFLLKWGWTMYTKITRDT